LITKLFTFLTEQQVNAFTGHSQNSHTALNNYFHIDRNWAGAKLLELTVGNQTMIEVSDEVNEKLEQDDAQAPEEELALINLQTSEGTKAETPNTNNIPLSLAPKNDQPDMATEVIRRDSEKVSRPAVLTALDPFCCEQGDLQQSPRVGSLQSILFRDGMRSSSGVYGACCCSIPRERRVDRRESTLGSTRPDTVPVQSAHPKARLICSPGANDTVGEG
jgi:hypothetical protein